MTRFLLAGLVVFLGCESKTRPVEGSTVGMRSEPTTSAPSANIPPPPDPIAPERPWVIRDRVDSSGLSPASSDLSWASTVPAEHLRRSASVEERKGVNPCAYVGVADPLGYEAMRVVPGLGRIRMPRQGAVDAQGQFNLVIHFHGEDAAEQRLIDSHEPIVWFGFNNGHSYRDTFYGKDPLRQVTRAIERIVSKAASRDATVGHLGLIAWSAGYDAIFTLLDSKQDGAVDAIVVLDGVHTARRDSTAAAQIAPLARFARLALDGSRFLLVTHSSVMTDGFASSTESIHRLLGLLGGQPIEAKRSDPEGLEMIHAYSKAGLHLRGYAGGKEADHCAHLGLIPMVMTTLQRRWSQQ